MPFVVLICVAVVVWFLASPFIVFGLWNRLNELEKNVKRLQLLGKSRPEPTRDNLIVPMEPVDKPSAALPTPVASQSPPPIVAAASAAASIDETPQIRAVTKSLDEASLSELLAPTPLNRGMACSESSKGVESDGQHAIPQASARVTPTWPEDRTDRNVHPPVEATKHVTDNEPSTLEEILAGKWLTWVGALAVIIGAGFGFKYAVENGWLDPSRRVILGLIVGACSFVGGAFAMRRDYRLLGQGLTGAAMGVLYMSCYAAHQWYDLVPYSVAFIGMALTTAVGLAFAARFDSQPTAFLGLLGGFLTPAMLQGSDDPFWVLFPYLLLLDAGVLWVSGRRRWLGAQNLAFTATCLSWLVWLATYQRFEPLQFHATGPFWPTLGFLTAFFVEFAAMGVIFNIARQQKAVAGDFFLILATPVAYFGAVYGLTYLVFPFWQGLFALGMTVVYGYLTVLCAQLNPKGKSVAAAMAGLAGTFLIIAAPLQFTGHWVTIAWIAESVLLVEIGLRFQEKTLTLTGLSLLAKVQFILLIYALGTFADPAGFQTAFVRKQFHLISGPAAHETSWTDLFNGRSFSYLVDVLGLAWLAWTCRRRTKAGQSDDLFGMKGRDLELWLAAGVPLVGLMLAITETFVWGMLRHWHGLTILSGFTMWAALAGVVLIAWSVFIGPRPLERLGWFLFVLMAGALLLNLGWSTTGLVERGLDAANWPVNWWLLNPRGFAFLSVLVAGGATALIYSTKTAERDDDSKPSDRVREEVASLQLIFTSGAFMTALAMVLQETFAWGVLRGWHGLSILSSLTIWSATFGAATIAWSAFVGPKRVERFGQILFLPMIGALAFSLLWTCGGVTARSADWNYWLAHWWLLNPRGFAFLSVLVAGVLTALIYRTAAVLNTGEQESSNERIPLDRLFGSGAFVLALTMVLLETFAWGKTHEWSGVTILNTFVVWTSLFGAGLAVWKFVRRSVGLDGLLVSTFVLLGGFFAINSIVTLDHAQRGVVNSAAIMSGSVASSTEGTVDWWLLNPRGLSFLLAVGAALLAARLERSLRQAQTDTSGQLGNAITRGEQFGLMACLVGLAVVLLETAAWGVPRHWLADTLASSLALGTAPFALGLAVWAAWYRRRVINGAVGAVFGLLGLCLFVSGITSLNGRSTAITVLTGETTVHLWLLHPRGAAFLVGIAVAGIAAALYLRVTAGGTRQRLTDGRDSATFAHDLEALTFSQTLGVSAWLAGLAMFTIESIAQGAARHWLTETSLAITLSWTAYALGTLIAGIYWRSGTVRVLSLSVFILTVAKVFLFDVWHLDTVIRVFAFVSLGVTLLLVSFLYRRYRERIRDWIAPAV